MPSKLERSVLSERRKNERIVQRLSAQVEILSQFLDRADAIPDGADPEAYFRDTLIAVAPLIASHQSALGKTTSLEMQTLVASVGANLARKRTEVIRKNGSLEEAVRTVTWGRQVSSHRLTLDDIVTIDSTSDPYSIVLTIEDEYVRGLSAAEPGVGSEGQALHVSGTPYILVNKNARNYQLCVRHERWHNLLDGTVGHVDLDHKLMQDVGEYGNIGEGPDVFNPAVYVDAFHDEIAGGIEFAISRDFSARKRPSTGEAEAHATDVERYVRTTGTAGVQMETLRRSILGLARLPLGPALQVRLLAFFTQVEKAFRGCIGHIEHSFRRIGEVKDRARQEALLDQLYKLSYLKKPSEYQEIATYFNAKAS